MAKKSTKTASKSKKTEAVASPVLPQNILAVGDRVEGNKNIYIAQNTYKKIHRFTQNKTVVESGGILVGSVVEELGKSNIMICGFVEAKFCDATPTTLKFTHETWEYVHNEIDKKYPGKKIVGWIHTHPDFGIFLSEYDKFIHENFFSEQNQVAYVVDPIQGIEGFYFWIDGKLEKCNGFFIYDKTGVTIDVNTKKEETSVKSEKPTTNVVKNVIIGILAFCVAFLMMANFSTNKELKTLKSDLATCKTQISTLEYNMYILQSLLFGGITEQPDTNNGTTEDAPVDITEDPTTAEPYFTEPTQEEPANE